MKIKNSFNRFGFTLLETVIYVALFSFLFTGIVVSIYPLFTGAERLTTTLLRENEAHFILSKIEFAISQTVTSPAGIIKTPSPNSNANELILGTNDIALYTFKIASSSADCSPPRVCSFITLTTNDNSILPLSNERLYIENFSATHTESLTSGDTERTLDLFFTINGHPIGPTRYYIQF